MAPMALSRPLKILIGLVGGFVLIQLVPYGHDHTNPPVTGEPTWDSPKTKAMFDRACADCHSHETKWPWYSNVAPVSWLVAHDIEEGREHLNFSDWSLMSAKDQAEAREEIIEEVEEGEMPIPIYPPLHPEAKLSPEEKTAFIAGLKATFGEAGDDD